MHPAISDLQGAGPNPRGLITADAMGQFFDSSDRTEGSKAIFWWNDVAKDRRYAQWPLTLKEVGVLAGSETPINILPVADPPSLPWPASCDCQKSVQCSIYLRFIKNYQLCDTLGIGFRLHYQGTAHPFRFRSTSDFRGRKV